MSELERLIAQYCPNGVEYVSVGELIKRKLVKTITPSFKIKRNDYKEVGHTPIISQEAEYISGYCEMTDENIPKKNYVCFGDHSEHIKYIDFAFVQGADGLKIMFTDESNLVTRYFYHATLSVYKRRNNYERHFKYFNDTVIPVPPLPVQREIVRILDKFTQLTAELTAELDARKKQYEFYRDKILSFDVCDDLTHQRAEDVIAHCPLMKLQKLLLKYCPNGVEYKRVGDIADVCTGNSNGNEAVDNGIYPFFIRSQIVKLKNEFEYDDEAIIIPGEGGIGDIFHYVNGKYALHQRVYRVYFTCDFVCTRFAYYYFSANFKSYIIVKAVDGTVKSIRKPMIEDFQIPVPPLPVQEYIVEILDRFDTLCNDIITGLPAEIAARQTQYEYYRDKLLTFERKA